MASAEKYGQHGSTLSRHDGGDRMLKLELQGAALILVYLYDIFFPE